MQVGRVNPPRRQVNRPNRTEIAATQAASHEVQLCARFVCSELPTSSRSPAALTAGHGFNWVKPVAVSLRVTAAFTRGCRVSPSVLTGALVKWVTGE